MPSYAIVGVQFGDEGKGKLVDILAQDADIVVRYAGGANAGHTIVHHGNKYKVNLLPSGILTESCTNVIANGVVLHLPQLFKELEMLDSKNIKYHGRLLISDRAHLLFDFHQILDGMNEKSLGKDEIGTTRRGIGPCYSTKAERINLRVCDLEHWSYFEATLRKEIGKLQARYHFEYDVEAEIEKYRLYREKVLPMVVDSVTYLNKAYDAGKKILFEGANAVMLDLDFGTYPFVTSSSPATGGVCTGTGIAPKKIGDVYGVVKAYMTRVGAGPFPTELLDGLGQKMRDVGFEYGTTTGRPRRCGWVDIPVIKYSHLISGYSSICLTKLDVLCDFDEIKIGTKYLVDGKEIEGFPASLETLAKVEVEYETIPGWKSDITQVKTYEELPLNCRKYIERLEELMEVPIQWVGVGPDREAIIEKKSHK